MPKVNAIVRVPVTVAAPGYVPAVLNPDGSVQTEAAGTVQHFPAGVAAWFDPEVLDRVAAEHGHGVISVLGGQRWDIRFPQIRS